MLNWAETLAKRCEESTRKKMQNHRIVRRLIKNGVIDVEDLSEHVGVAKTTMQKYLNNMGYKVRNGKVTKNDLES